MKSNLEIIEEEFENKQLENLKWRVKDVDNSGN